MGNPVTKWYAFGDIKIRVTYTGETKTLEYASYSLQKGTYEKPLYIVSLFAPSDFEPSYVQNEAYAGVGDTEAHRTLAAMVLEECLQEPRYWIEDVGIDDTDSILSLIEAWDGGKWLEFVEADSVYLLSDEDEQETILPEIPEPVLVAKEFEKFHYTIETATNQPEWESKKLYFITCEGRDMLPYRSNSAMRSGLTQAIRAAVYHAASLTSRTSHPVTVQIDITEPKTTITITEVNENLAREMDWDEDEEE